MPNQLAKSKSRQSVAEHKAVLAAFAALSRREETTVVALMRQALRTFVRTRAANPVERQFLRSVVWDLVPQLPTEVRSRAQVSRFKRDQREFDRVMLDLQLAAPEEIEARNSIAKPDEPIRMIDFAGAHAKA